MKIRTSNPFQHHFLTGVMTLALAALSATNSMAQTPLTVLTNRTTQTDSSINTDYKGYQAQQGAIKTLNDSGKHAVKSYSLAKAQCWLDVSFHEYSRNDRSSFPQAAMNESIKITTYLKDSGLVAGENNPANKTLLVNNADKLRDDLWTQANSLKTHQGYNCAEKQLACAEEELVHAGNEHRQQGWRHAKPYVQIAEDLIGEAKVAAEACIKPAPAYVPPPAPAPVPVAQPPIVKTITIEKIILNVSALFKFDKRTQADLLPQGKSQLDDLAQKINSVYASVDNIVLVGYTDRLGTDAYNAQLGLDRAQTVKAYLQARGITASMTTNGKGAADPVVNCAGNVPTPTLTQCLQPNRRVELTISGVKR